MKCAKCNRICDIEDKYCDGCDSVLDLLEEEE